MPVLSLPRTLTAQEGRKAAVRIAKEGEGACTATVRTKAATATWNEDYVGLDPTAVAFAAHDAERTVLVEVRADALREAGETFQVLLENPRGCTLGNAACTVTIADPAPPRPRVSVPERLAVDEGGEVAVTVSKSGDGACSVSLRTKAGTAAWDRDYAGVGPVTVAFAAGETRRTVKVRVRADAAKEPTETFRVLVEDPRGCTLGNAACAVAVRDVPAKAPPKPTPPPGPVVPPPDPPKPPPGTMARAVGFSRNSSFGLGRSGGDYYRVTNLDDSGPGSLGAALGLSNRVVVFEVGGTIRWKTDHNVTGSNLTVAGETAPYPGIVIQGNRSPNGGTLKATARSSGVKWSHVTFERGYADPGGGEGRYNTNADAVSVGPAGGTVLSDWHFDHCAFFWSNDENVQLHHSSAGPYDTTGVRRWDFTNCMICEPLAAPEKLGLLGHWENGKPERNHNYNFLVGRYCRDVSIQHCLFTEHRMRGPFIDTSASCVLANNLALNCSMGASVEMNQSRGLEMRPHRVTCVGYLMISGPNAPNPHAAFRFVTYGGGTGIRDLPAGSSYYVHGLYAMRGSDPGCGLAPTQVTWDTSTKYGHAQVAQPGVLAPRDGARPIDIPGAPVQAMAAEDIYARAVANVGPRPKEDGGRRAVPSVRNAVEKLRRRTGRWVDHEDPKGGGVGKMPFTETRRKLDGTTRFDDGTPIPAPPPYADADAVRDWLDLFARRLQHD